MTYMLKMEVHVENNENKLLQFTEEYATQISTVPKIKQIRTDGPLGIHIYLCIYTYHTCIYIYIYLQRERERDV